MTGEVIKSFLVGLGFEVDDSSLAKFNKAISTAAVRVTALYTSIKLAASGIVYGISKISEGFEQMGYEYRLIAPMINKTLQLRRELLKAYAAAGINITKVVQNSVKLNFSLTKTKFAFEAIYRSVASRFFPLITKQSDIFREKLYKNMPKIQAGMERFVKVVFKAFEATVTLGTRLWSILSRVYDTFAKLHEVTNGWSTAIIGFIVAWKALNLSFLATPLGMILTGMLAILALYDDFKTFQEGGKSLFNWGPVLPYLDKVKNALSGVLNFVDNLAEAVTLLVYAFKSLLTLDFSTMWEMLKGVGSALGNGFSAPMANPIGSNVANSQTNQNVRQQTTINVQGSADANSVGKSVAGEQSKVNFDMVRNMKGATR